jgi:8-oxo-dGTP diphosphatase
VTDAKERRTVVVVSGALFSPDGKLLLLHEKKSCGENDWALPGGVLEFGETPELGLVRAFQESTGLDISVDRPLGAWSAVMCENGVECHAVHLDYTVRLSGTLLGVDVDREAHAGFTWETLPGARNKVFSPPVKSAIERAFAALARSRKNG